MRLKKAQKEFVIELVAEGLRTDEINARAAKFRQPFDVSRQQVDYYRKTRKKDIQAITEIDENSALNRGYAKREHRVFKLQKLAKLIELDLFGGFLWLDQEKGVGSGDNAKIVEYEEFNKAEVDAYLRIMEDIAKETGGRVAKSDVTSGGEKIEPKVFDEGFNRSISALSDALREIIPDKSPE